MDMKETSQEQEVKLVYVNNLNKAKKEMEGFTCLARMETGGFADLIQLAGLFMAIGYRSCLRTLELLSEED